MTDERDFDRLARAWLELGPDEAPDRVVAAVLQAAQTTPQVRRPLRWPIWRSLNMNRVPLAAGAAAVLVVIIGGWILLSQRNQPAIGGPVTSPSVAPSPSLEAGIVLQRAPTNLGCDAVPSTWDSATIHIDPESDIYLEIGRPPWDGRTDTVNVDVWAEADTGALLAVYWTAGFNATDGDPPVIRGPRGEEVARDGTRIPPGLADYFLCGGPESLHILEYQPG
jgi:hypothetical protein